MVDAGEVRVADAMHGKDRKPAPIWNIPNQLTVARLILSVVFFVLLAMETHGDIHDTLVPGKIKILLNASILVFVLAVLTDFLDGYLARKWGLVSTFGRIADPFADKIVICGGFIMLTGLAPRVVEPWYAVVIIFREFLVSGLRSFLESRGVAFGAAASGKLKMVLQSITIPVVIFYQANIVGEPINLWDTIWWWVVYGFLSMTLLLTVGSCLSYIQRAIVLIRAQDGSG
jgi:CDP-diacylglycerol--glycerol-3-phosphate 3-phosphatidyltransferase